MSDADWKGLCITLLIIFGSQSLINIIFAIRDYRRNRKDSK